MRTDQVFPPFSKAACEAFKRMLDLDVNAGVPEQTAAHPDARKGLNIVIGMTGDMNGEILYHFPKDTALEMVKIMCGGMEVAQMDDFVTSAMGEIANIISGNAMTGLSEQNMVCDIQPPVILVDELPAAGANSAVCSEISTPVGSLALEIREN